MPYDSDSQLPANVRSLPAKRRRQWIAVWNSSYAACMKDEFGRPDKCESEAFAKANGVIKGAEADMAEPLEMSGTPSTIAIYFAQSFHEAGGSGWVHYMPAPGLYKSPRYGDIRVTKERNEQFVKGFKEGVYQKHIPIDAEHETKLSGAVGWINDMRMNEDGSVDAFIEWTERGTRLLASGNFKYFSPEWYDAWKDPATEIIHMNVVAGGAITTRPFFKEPALRALVASEDGEMHILSEEAAMKKCEGCGCEMSASTDGSLCPDCKAKKSKENQVPDEPNTITMSEADLDARIKAAIQAAEAETTTKLTELESKVATAEATAAAEKARAEATEATLTAMTKTAREQRFRSMIAGQGGQDDGAPWVGDADKHLSTLVAMAEGLPEGESNEAFVNHLENQRAAAQQAKEAKIFEEVGSPAIARDGTPQASYEQALKKFSEAHADLDAVHAEAAFAATEEGRRLYTQASRAGGIR